MDVKTKIYIIYNLKNLISLIFFYNFDIKVLLI